MEPGTRVKPSEYAILPKRDYWLSRGDSRSKSAAKDELDREMAKRGTVTAILSGDRKRGISPGIEVTWDNGAVSRCLSYMVEPA